METLSAFGLRVIAGRKQDGLRSTKTDEYRLRLLGDLGDRTLSEISLANLQHLFRSLRNRLSPKTLQRFLCLLRNIFAEAVRHGHISSNPCLGLKVARAKDAIGDGEHDGWDFLTREEQVAVLNAPIPEPHKLLMLFAIGTGLRQGEQWNLELRDVHTDGPEPYVFVRWGSKGQPPKNGRRRKVPLFGIGLSSIQRWLEIRPAHSSDLVFPSATGKLRQPGAPETVRNGKKVELLSEWLKEAGIERRIRWHDLRHTFCSSLVSGAWGRVWSLSEVKEIAGHSDISVTQRYSHIGDKALADAAKATRLAVDN